MTNAFCWWWWSTTTAVERQKKWTKMILLKIAISVGCCVADLELYRIWRARRKRSKKSKLWHPVLGVSQDLVSHHDPFLWNFHGFALITHFFCPCFLSVRIGRVSTKSQICDSHRAWRPYVYIYIRNPGFCENQSKFLWKRDEQQQQQHHFVKTTTATTTTTNTENNNNNYYYLWGGLKRRRLQQRRLNSN